MVERTFFCPACKKKVTLVWDKMYSKSDIQKCEKCGLTFQMVNGEIKKCYAPGYMRNPITGEKMIIDES